MHKIAVMGDRDSIFGFASLGMHIFPVDDPAEAAPMLHKMAESGYAVIFITRPVPGMVPVPGVEGDTGMGMKNVSRSVQKAVGSDILDK